MRLDELKEGALERGAQRLDFPVEVDCLHGALGDALGGELEFLPSLLDSYNMNALSSKLTA